jgi:hypothetical protein
VLRSNFKAKQPSLALTLAFVKLLLATLSAKALEYSTSAASLGEPGCASEQLE